MPNKYVLYGALALIAITIITGAYFSWKAAIKQEALLEFNNKQLQEVVAEQQKTNQNMKIITERSKEIVDTMNKKNEELDLKFKNFQDFLSEEESKPSPESSDVLKRTIRELGGK